MTLAPPELLSAPDPGDVPDTTDPIEWWLDKAATAQHDLHEAIERVPGVYWNSPHCDAVDAALMRLVRASGDFREAVELAQLSRLEDPRD